MEQRRYRNEKKKKKIERIEGQMDKVARTTNGKKIAPQSDFRFKFDTSTPVPPSQTAITLRKIWITWKYETMFSKMLPISSHCLPRIILRIDTKRETPRRFNVRSMDHLASIGQSRVPSSVKFRETYSRSSIFSRFLKNLTVSYPLPSLKQPLDLSWKFDPAALRKKINTVAAEVCKLIRFEKI